MDFVQENEERECGCGGGGGCSGWRSCSLGFKGRGRKKAAVKAVHLPSPAPAEHREVELGQRPFPENLWTEVVYSDQFQLTCTAGALQQYTFAMNGLYDPNLTGTGSQPRYFDTLCGANTTAAPYRAYVVKAARMKVMAYAQGPDSAGIPSVVAISGIAGTSTGPSTVTEQMQRNDTNYGLLSYYAGGKPIATVYRTCEVAPTLGVKDIEDANGTNAAYSANPTNLAHFVVTVAPLNQSTAPVINLNVEIRYWVKFYSLNDVVDS